MLRVAGLTKHYGSLAALDNVSFSVHSGEILGLIGPNGAGKTTLFECMAGVLPAGGGSVLIDGHPITARERSAALFYLPDAIAPWPSRPVQWALDFTIAFFGGRRDLLNELIEVLAARGDLGSNLQRVRVGCRVPAAVCGRRPDRAVGQDRQHQLLQRLCRQFQVGAHAERARLTP